MSFHAPTPSLRQKPPRHALLFELIRQRSMAKHVNMRVMSRPPNDPDDLAAIARAAEHSLGILPESAPPVL